MVGVVVVAGVVVLVGVPGVVVVARRGRGGGAVVVAGVVVPVGVLGVVVGLLGYVFVGAAVAVVAISEAASVAHEAVGCGAGVARASAAARDPVEVSPSVSSSLVRLASADCRVALACSRVTSALCGSSVASSWPCATCSPWVT